MKITHKTLMVNFETEVKIGRNDAIELTLIHQAFISRNKNGDMDVDIEFMDVTNGKFLGIEIEGNYSEFKKFKETMLTLGIDVNKLIDEKEKELMKSDIEDELKEMFRHNI